MDAALVLNNIGFKAGEARLLDKVSCAVNAGEILAVVGPNGAGKSTLMNIASGNLQTSEGSVTLAGRDLQGWRLQDRARHLAVLPQQQLLNFPFTVRDVVLLGRTAHDTGAEADAVIIAAMLEKFDISHIEHRIYTQLSGGEKQRVQLARVMAQVWSTQQNDSRVLLLDEPTAALDLAHQQMLMQVTRQFADEGAAVVMVMHDIDLAAQYADSMLGLRDGQVVAQGPVSQVVNAEVLGELFGVAVEIMPHPHNKRPVILRL